MFRSKNSTKSKREIISSTTQDEVHNANKHSNKTLILDNVRWEASYFIYIFLFLSFIT